MNIPKLHALFLKSTGVCTDTRKLVSGQLYFALKGDNFDGNAFAKAAIDKGAAAAIVDDASLTGDHIIKVPDALTSLQQLATYHRTYLNIPIIGLTGSNGKTTTKELINGVVARQYKTVATKGNLNNHIGVPLTLLSMSEATEIGIVEMGANHQKEIELLSKIANPTIGYITNFGKAHLEGFGGIEGVIKGKSELYDHLRMHEALAIVNTDDPLQVKQAQGLKQFSFGSQNADVTTSMISATPFVVMQLEEIEVKSQLIGSYNAHNIAAAMAIGMHLDISKAEIKKGIEDYQPANNRSQIIEKKGYTIILDAYNANPTSMEAALHNLSLQKHSFKVAFLGDMYEVGEDTAVEHKRIAKIAQDLEIDQVHAVGAHFYTNVTKTNQLTTYPNFEVFGSSFQSQIPKEAVILIKGSRGMAMERVLDLIT
ncbi:MAG: UDP-N-acetylmuramoyl-tripeptide--D-alanyl-D-alanine ligase [Dokdonia sp.]|jgi:UDP-N-acetylmuramoyl-tripeptide--D-alanyl-D-alanine ligase